MIQMLSCVYEKCQTRVINLSSRLTLNALSTFALSIWKLYPRIENEALKNKLFEIELRRMPAFIKDLEGFGRKYDHQFSHEGFDKKEIPGSVRLSF